MKQQSKVTNYYSRRVLFAIISAWSGFGAGLATGAAAPIAAGLLILLSVVMMTMVFVLEE